MNVATTLMNPTCTASTNKATIYFAPVCKASNFDVEKEEQVVPSVFAERKQRNWKKEN